MTSLPRRTWLGAATAAGLLAVLPSTASGEETASNDFDVKDLTVGSGKAKRFTLLVPKNLPKGATVPLVVALHGAGEAHDEKMGAFAWLDRYGLRTSYERISHPPVTRRSKLGYFTDARLDEVNRALKKRPFGGLAIACPYTPNPKDQKDRSRFLDDYAAWIADQVIPLARKEAPITATTAKTTLVGCSMGGTVAIETFSRRPEVFGGLGFVQGALSDYAAKKHARILKDACDQLGKRDVEILSSEGDPFVGGARALKKALDEQGVEADLRILPGPHDQPWLREAGALEMLFYQDRRP